MTYYVITQHVVLETGFTTNLYTFVRAPNKDIASTVKTEIQKNPPHNLKRVTVLGCVPVTDRVTLTELDKIDWGGDFQLHVYPSK